MSHRLILGSLLLTLLACAPPAPLAISPLISPASAPAGPELEAPSRLRDDEGNSKIKSFATYYAVPDSTTLRRLARRDLKIVQPNITSAQLLALKTTGYSVVYLSLGELGTSNTYYVNGKPVQGSVLYEQHKNEGWFVGKNGNFGAYLLNLTRADVRNFLLEQARALLARGFDGLFLDTVDDAEFFQSGTPATELVSGQLTLYAGRPDYPTMRRAYIVMIKELREAASDALLVQNGGFDVLLDSLNDGDGSQGYVDAVMHEVAITKSRKPDGAKDDHTWPSDPANYESWPQHYARVAREDPEQADLDERYRKARDDHALTYFRAGGVVLQQDFALPESTVLQCLSYSYARDLRAREHRDGWIAAYSDASFQKLFDYAESSPEIRKIPECSTYDHVIAPGIDITFRPPTVGSAAGRRGTVTLTIVPLGGHTGRTDLSLGALPTGITGTLSEASVHHGPSARVTLSYAVGEGVAPGTHVIPVLTTGQGRTRQYNLHVTVYRTQGDTVWVGQAGLGNVLAYDSSPLVTAISLPSREMGNYTTLQPWAVAVDAEGNVYVAEYVGGVGNTNQGRVRKYAPFGLYPGGETTEITGLNYPSGIAIDAQGRLWVAQSGVNAHGGLEGTSRVSRFDAGSIQEATGFALPSGLGYPNLVATGQGHALWVTTTWGLLLRYDASMTPPALKSIYSLPDVLDSFGGIAIDNTDLWLSGTITRSDASGRKTVNSRVVRLATAALPPGNGIFGVSGVAAVKATITDGLYQPAGLGLDRDKNLWVVNKTGVAGLSDPNSTDHGTLVRFPASSLRSSNPVMNLKVDLGSRYPVGLAVGRP